MIERGVLDMCLKGRKIQKLLNNIVNISKLAFVCRPYHDMRRRCA